MKIKISSQYSGVIPTASYQNARPGFEAELEFEYEGKPGDDNGLKDTIKKNQDFLHQICYDNFKRCEQQALVEKLERERADLRLVPDPQGVLMPSVTSVINFDADMFVPPDELQEYASQGNIIHAQVAEFIKIGKWVEPKEIPDVWADLVIVSKGKLKLALEGWSFPDFLAKNPISGMKNSERSMNLQHRYAGGPDFEGVPDFKDIDKVPTLFDVKRTADKIKNFKQIAAYCKMNGYEHIKQMGIVVLNDKTAQGFSKPIIETRIDEYFKMFLRDREAFRKRFGI